jgi:hypothetical protein
MLSQGSTAHIVTQAVPNNFANLFAGCMLHESCLLHADGKRVQAEQAHGADSPAHFWAMPLFSTRQTCQAGLSSYQEDRNFSKLFQHGSIQADIP